MTLREIRTAAVVTLVLGVGFGFVAKKVPEAAWWSAGLLIGSFVFMVWAIARDFFDDDDHGPLRFA